MSRFLYDNGVNFTKAEIEFGMTRYALINKGKVIDCDNNVFSLAMRNNLPPNFPVKKDNSKSKKI